MKIITTILVLLSLISSAQAVACSVYVNVTNETGTTLDNVKVKGPYGRRSSGHELKHGGSFKYHAVGSFLTCHGEYHLTDAAGDPYCDITMSKEDDNVLVFKEDGTGCFIISGDKYETPPRKCLIDSYKC